MKAPWPELEWKATPTLSPPFLHMSDWMITKENCLSSESYSHHKDRSIKDHPIRTRGIIYIYSFVRRFYPKRLSIVTYLTGSSLGKVPCSRVLQLWENLTLWLLGCKSSAITTRPQLPHDFWGSWVFMCSCVHGRIQSTELLHINVPLPNMGLCRLLVERLLSSSVFCTPTLTHLHLHTFSKSNESTRNWCKVTGCPHLAIRTGVQTPEAS